MTINGNSESSCKKRLLVKFLYLRSEIWEGSWTVASQFKSSARGVKWIKLSMTILLLWTLLIPAAGSARAAGAGVIKQIGAGANYSLALKTDGMVYAWGSENVNAYGVLDIPAGLSGVTALAAGGYHALALKSDGTVVAWGNGMNSRIDVPAGLNNVIAIAAGSAHSLALKGNGDIVVWGWGEPDVYGLKSVPGDAKGASAIAAGVNHNLALRSDGRVVAWGLQ